VPRAVKCGRRRGKGVREISAASSVGADVGTVEDSGCQGIVPSIAAARGCASDWVADLVVSDGAEAARSAAVAASMAATSCAVDDVVAVASRLMTRMSADVAAVIGVETAWGSVIGLDEDIRGAKTSLIAGANIQTASKIAASAATTISTRDKSDGSSNAS